MDLNDKIKLLIENELVSINLNPYPSELYKPIAYILALKAKRLRPLLTVLCYKLFQKDYEKIIPCAALVEVFHNFTLMHDDILDQSHLRRNEPTVNSKWNNNIAILSGDAMLIKLYSLFYDRFKNHRFDKVFPIFNDSALAICEGQQLDMNFEKQNSVTTEEYLLMIKMKTAKLIGFSTQLGALMANVQDDTAQVLYDFGESIGMAFQLQDDWLDTFGNEKQLGKPIGQDIVNNKKTYLLIQALNKAKPLQKKILIAWLKKKDFNHQEKIASVQKIYLDLAIDKLSKKLINHYFNSAFSKLTLIKTIYPEAKDNLKATIQKLIDRQL